MMVVSRTLNVFWSILLSYSLIYFQVPRFILVFLFWKRVSGVFVSIPLSAGTFLHLLSRLCLDVYELAAA